MRRKSERVIVTEERMEVICRNKYIVERMEENLFILAGSLYKGCGVGD